MNKLTTTATAVRRIISTRWQGVELTTVYIRAGQSTDAQEVNVSQG
jgi:hypothetical protein